MLRGQRVVLRPVRRSDLKLFLKWFNDPEVIQYLGSYLPMTEMAEEKYIEELGTTRLNTDTFFVIEAIEGDDTKPIGEVYLQNIHPKDHHAMFGIAIGEKEYWRRGYGTEATRIIVNYGFEQLNLHRINSGVHAFNERSLRMHRAVGFKEEGRQRNLYFINGSFHDHVMFGILREEWKGL